MSAGDFRPVRGRCCSVCGALGEWAGYPGFPCPECREESA